jgi:catechol 2,3-dioxygenase-like lactoylglutathione lyase family enzyme
MPGQLHHVVMRSHSAQTLIAFFTEVVGMQVQQFMGTYAPEANSGTSEATNS